MSTSYRDAHAHLKERIWEAVHKSNLDLTAVPQATTDALVDLAADVALLELDEKMEEELTEQRKTSPADVLLGPSDEETLWEGRPFLSLVTQYVITTERIRIIEGLLGKSREDIELVRVQDVDQSQTLSERVMNLGDITIRSHDRNYPEVVLRNIKDPQAVHEILRRAVLNARQKHNLVYREEM